MEDDIQIRLRGKGIKPGLIRSKEIAEILESIEDMVVAETIKLNPTIAKEEIVVGVYQILDKSIGLKFKTSLTTIVLPTFLATLQSIENGDFDSLSYQSLKSLQAISHFSRRHKCNAELSTSINNCTITITPESIIPQPFLIEGLSEITGKVIRVGGKRPRAMLELIDGATIYCDIPENMAKELGQTLYEYVKFEGVAKWSSRNFDLEEFSITNFVKFPETHPNEILGKLTKEIGLYFSDIKDVPAFVSQLRQEGGLS